MSYSFSVRGATKGEVITKVADELAKVVTAQPVHASDQAQAQAATEAFVDLLGDDDAKDVAVSVNGSVQSSNGGLLQSSFNVNASLVNRT
jgi:hypothetical protein